MRVEALRPNAILSGTSVADTVATTCLEALAWDVARDQNPLKLQRNANQSM
jgi:hypothetical protein